MTTALDIIKRAMQEAGILYKQETPDADESSDALARLNAMLQSFSTDSMLITSRDRETFSLTGAQSYTIGSGGDFNTTRPIYIIEAHVTSGSVTYPMGKITDVVYERITQKNITGIPEFYNYSNGYPLGTLYLYPVGGAEYTLHLTSEKPLTSFSALTTTVSLSPGWEELLVYNLAVRLCPSYGQTVTPELKYLAENSRANVEIAIAKNRSLDAYPEKAYSGNIYNGWLS